MVIERSTGGETATHDTQHTAVAAADHPRHIYLLLPPHRTRRAALVAEELSKTLPDDGFLVSTVAWPPNIAELKGRFIISLLELDRPLLSCLESADFDTLRQTVLQARRLLWVCAGSDPRMEIAIGLLRVLQNENISKEYQHILLEDKPGRSASDFSRPIAKVIGTETQELEFSERDGWLHIPRWMHEPEMTRTVAKSEEMIQFGTALVGEVRPSLPVRMLHGANLDNAHFVPDNSHDSKLLPDEVEIEICSIVLNEDDTGSQGSLSLREASGVVKAVGRDVSGLRPAARVCVVFLGHLSSNAVVKEAHCHQIPDSVSMREAACLPITFATAYRAVIDVACVRPRQTVFVQAAGTKIGRAAALLAKASGAIVYATTENHGEVKWLEALGVSSRNILVKGDPDLVTAMRAITKGRGLDVIIRTSEPTELHCSLSKCLAPNGSLVDIRYQAVFPGGPHAETSAEDITDFVTSAGEPLRWDSALRKKTITNSLGLLSELSTIGKSSISFSSDRIVEALKCQRKQSGRRNVLLSFDDRDRIPISPSVENRFHLTSQATYVLAGGMGGVGRGLARFLVANGARSLVFLSRSGAESSHAKDLVKEMENKDVEVAVFACDVADGDALAAILATCRKTMPPIRGVIQAATVIRDAIFDNLTSENWQTNLRPKVQGSWNLHTQLPRDMDFFVMLSSIVGLIGHRSQAGYAAGNTYQDALAHYRRARGLPAVSIDLGAMADVGTITEGTTAASFSASDAAWMNETELHRIASMCISGAVYRRPVPPPQVCTGLFTGGMLRAGRQEEPIHFERPFFAVLKNLGVSSVATEITTASTDKAKDLIEQLGLATSIEDAHFCISEVLRLRLTKELGLTPEAVDLHKPLHQYDIDSLKAVDLKSWIGKVLKADVSTFDVLNADSVSALASEIVRVSELVANGLK
jgi:NADPH:quinone reductase-like Zn-dependent oxidoreductase/NAD(P)-dependent dehydrogenase (short-subunit alcohol dehydrogenase family)